MGRYSEIVWLPVRVLKPHPLNDSLFGKASEKEMELFVESYREVGQIEVITVMENGDGTYTILSGHQRVEAAKRAGAEKVPARIFYPDYPGEEKKVLIYSNIVRRNISYANMAEVSNVLATCRSPEEIEENLIPELAKLMKSKEVDISVLSTLSQFTKDEQREFLSLIRIYQKFTGKDKFDMDDFERMKQADEQVKKENPELAEQIEKLNRELYIKDQLIIKYKKELMGKEKLYEAALKDKIELKEKLEELQEELEKAKKEGREEAEREIQKRIEQYEKSLKEREEELKKAQVEAASLRYKIEEQEKKIKAFEKIEKIYERKLREMEQERKEREEELKKQFVKKLQEEHERASRIREEVLSEKFREEVLRFYRSDPELPEMLREDYRWFVTNEYFFNAAEAFLMEARQRIKRLFAPENYPKQVLPDQVFEIKKRWVERLDRMSQLFTETADLAAKAHPNKILEGVSRMMEKLSKPFSERKEGGDEK